MCLYSSELNLMVEIFNDAFAGIVTRKQGDALEDFKMTAERNGITVCAPGKCTIKIDITIISIHLFIYFLFATQTKIEYYLQHNSSYVYNVNMLWFKYAFG